MHLTTKLIQIKFAFSKNAHSSAHLVNPVSKVTATDNSALDSPLTSNVPVL